MLAQSADVLIIEDEPVVVLAAERVLASQGIVVDRALSAESALEKFRAGSYRVILADLMLPGSSGFQFLELAQEKTPRPEVIMITGYATRDNALESFRQGAFDFLPKPFDAEELLGVVYRGLRFFDQQARATRPTERRAATAEAPGQGRRYFLGRHSWARLDPDGSTTIGVAETFPNLLGRLISIELLAPGNHVAQAEGLGKLTSEDHLLYRVWSPLSGRIIALNHEVEGNPDLIDLEPFAAGWLTRIIPANLKGEVTSLTERDEAAAELMGGRS